MNNNSKISVSENENEIQYLINKTFPSISLPNQMGNFLRLDRSDTFRMIIYCFPMTGRPDRSLPDNWNNIKDAKGCTFQICSLRDNYDKIISLNSIPICISTQTVGDNKEMSSRLRIPYDVLSDQNLELKNLLNLPYFLTDNKIYFKQLTFIIEKNIIKKIFYPIYNIDYHIKELLEWLQEN
tara:strand:+ start:413 stop:958 length:546 start_codon:yes stop_codon:yes gene_type:complete